MTQQISATSCCSKIIFTNASPCEKFLEDLFFIPLLNGKAYSPIGIKAKVRETEAGSAEAKPSFLCDVCKIVCFVALFFISIPLLCIRNHNRKNLIASQNPQSTQPKPNPQAATSPGDTPTQSPKNEFEYWQQKILAAKDPKLPESYDTGGYDAYLTNFLAAYEEHHIHEVMPNVYLSGIFETGYNHGIIHLNGIKQTADNPHKFGVIIRLSEDYEGWFSHTQATSQNGERSLHNGAFSEKVTRSDFTFENLKDCLILSMEALARKETVFINCRQGCDRSPAFAALLSAVVYDTTVLQSSWLIGSIRLVADPFCMHYGGDCENLLPRLKADPQIKLCVEQLREKMSQEGVPNTPNS